MPDDPAYREAQLCTELIANRGPMVSLDVMEPNPALEVRNKTAPQAVDLIETPLGKSTFAGNGQRLQHPEANRRGTATELTSAARVLYRDPANPDNT